MPKRTLAVFAAAAFGAMALPFGLPTVAHATGPTYDDIVFEPLPIEVAGTLPEGNSVTICVQPQEGGVHLTGAAAVYLSINSGQYTAPSAAGGSATVGGTPLTVNPALFMTQPTCSFANSQGSGTSMWAVPVTYTAPSPTVPIDGRDVIVAADSPSDVTITPANPPVAAFGTCNGAGTCKTGAYVFSAVTQYIFSTSTIAATGSLSAGQPVTFTVTAEDVTNHAVPGSFIDLSLVPSMSGSAGSATAINILGNPPTPRVKAVTNLPTRFGADPNGMVSITYTAANPLPGNGDVDTLRAQNHPTETVESVPPATYTYAGTGPPPPTANPYTAITPFRVCDTRPTSQGITANQCNTGSTGAGSGPIGQTPRVVTIQGFGTPAVPAGATAVVVNVTAIAPTAPTFVTLYPDLSGNPGTSNLNVGAHQVVANLVEVGLSAGGKIDVFNAAGSINIALDIEGYTSSASPGKYNALAAPVRICDTRAAGGSVPSTQCNQSGSHPILSSGPVLTFNVHTLTDNVPATGVTAVIFNLTAISPSLPTALTAYPSDVSRPTASNINLNPGAAVPNRVIVPVSSTGTVGDVSIWNGAGSVNVAVDIDGYFQASSGQQFTPLAQPFRVCDTRKGNSADGGETTGCVVAKIVAGSVLNIDVTGIDGIPQAGQAGAPTAIVANVTAANATTTTFITVYPGPDTSGIPDTSDLNVASSGAVPNLVVVGVDSVDGTINLYNALGDVNLIVDIYGYYS